jgi:hypothetical protein
MIKAFFAILIFYFVLAGCTKDPVNTFPPDKNNTLDYPSTLSDLSSFLASGYSNFRKDFFLYGFDLLTKEFACSEHAACLAYNPEQDWDELATNRLSVYNLYAGRLWEGLYTGVKNCNVFFDRANFYVANYSKPGDSVSVNQMRGQAYFLRAFYYFDLECFFGESYITKTGGSDKMGVPVFTDLAQTLADTHHARETTRQVWDLIISDLKMSSQLLKGVQWDANNVGRATEWSAKTLLGKAYVFTQEWDSAKTVLKDVIDNSGKTLMPFSKYKNAFNGNPANEFNEESIFEINVERVTDGYGIFTNTPSTNLTTSAGLIWAPSILGYNGTEDGAGNNELGYGNEFVHDKNLQRFGFNLPIFTFIKNPNGAGTRQQPDSIMDPTYFQQSVDIRNNKIADPRLYVCALQPFVDSCGNFDGSQTVAVARCNNIGDKRSYQGWSFRKFTTMDKSLSAYNGSDGANIYVLRLADVYLLYAEACMNTGDNANALEYINKVHRRAYSVPTNAASVYDYANLTAPTKADPSDINLTNRPLAFERHAELFAEGDWWFDVCRWRIGANEAAYYATGISDTSPINWNDDRSYSYPIPGTEISSNPEIASHQNPGY